MGALTGKEKLELRKAGFLYREISYFNNAKTPDGKHFQNLNTSSQNWRDMLQSRRDWVERLRERKWSETQIINEIMAYYANKETKRTPFDFLQLESSPHAKAKKPTDYQIIRQREKRKKVKHNFGRLYAAKPTVRHLRRPVRR